MEQRIDQPPDTPYHPYRPTTTSGFAVASLVLGIVWIGWLGSTLAIVFGHIALRKTRDPRVGGRGLAIAGLVLGYIGAATLAWIIFATVVLGGAASNAVDQLNRYNDCMAAVDYTQSDIAVGAAINTCDALLK